MILLIRASRSAFAFGEFIGPAGTALYTFSVMSVLCFVIGGQFSLACAIASDKINREAALGRVYLYESLGAVIGGVIFTYTLIGSVPTFIIALALSFGCILVNLGLSRGKGSILLAAACLLILSASFKAEPAVNRIEWKGYQFIKQKEARNATLSLVNMGSIKNVFVDGMLSASFPAPENYEPVAHWPLLAVADPGRILIIGDASLGVLKDALKHSPKRIDYVVSDSSFIDLVRPYLEGEDIAALNDPSVHIHYADSRAFVRDNENKYDAVIINVPEVPNLKTNRLFTEEFYGRLKDILKPDGILGLSVASSENYLSMQTRLFNASVFGTLKSVFKDVEVIPGDSLMLLAGRSAVDMQKETLLGRFNKRNISNNYVIPSYIVYKLEAKRRAELKKLLEGASGAGINRDFRPTTCYYFADFWLNKFTSPPGYLAVTAILIAIALGIFKKRRSLLFFTGGKENILIFVLGFTGIMLELILLLGYQVISGYVYWQMGMLFSSFMLGLFLGSFLGNQFKDKSRQWHSISLVILSLIIMGVSVSAAYLLPHFIYLSTARNIVVFTALLVIIGAVVGAAFVIAGFLIRADDVMAKAGNLYAADLWGAALGAILSTNFIVPVFGIIGALNLSAIIGAAGLAIFLILSKRTGLR
jgi:spermidine synthase